MVLTHPQLSVDLWSSGTLVAALHVGRQLFEGHDELTQLQAVIDLLGPPLDVWPGCADLHLWREYEGSLANRQPEMPPNEKLASREVVRPLPEGHPAIDLILRLLVWDPGSRMTAAEALQHPFFEVDPAPIVGSSADPRLGPSSRRSGVEGVLRVCRPPPGEQRGGSFARRTGTPPPGAAQRGGPAFLRTPTWTRGSSAKSLDFRARRGGCVPVFGQFWPGCVLHATDTQTERDGHWRLRRSSPPREHILRRVRLWRGGLSAPAQKQGRAMAVVRAPLPPPPGWWRVCQPRRHPSHGDHMERGVADRGCQRLVAVCLYV